MPDDASAPHVADAGRVAHPADTDAHAQAHADAPSGGGPGPRGLGAAHVLLPLGHDAPSPARPEPPVH